jgi:hypothetical protein
LRRDLKKLLIGNEAIKQLEDDIERLSREIEMTTGAAAIAESDAREDIARHLSDIGWEQLVRLFLKT